MFNNTVQNSISLMNRASFPDSSLPRCTLYTSTVQDLHPPQDFSSRDNLMLTFKVCTLELSFMYD